MRERNRAIWKKKFKKYIAVWRVLACDRTRLVWTVRSTHYNEEDALQHQEALRHKGLAAMIQEHATPILTIMPQNHSKSKEWREAEAQKLMDLADARKRYKSPG